MKRLIKLKQINKQIVKPIPLPEQDTRPIKGCDLCSEAYANIFLCARKNSGKTSALFKILKECSGKKTRIIAFCSTLYKDKNWIAIRKYFEEKDREFDGFTSIYDEGEDQIAKLIATLSDEAKAKEDEEDNEDGEPVISSSEKCDNILEKLKLHNNILGQFLHNGTIGEGEVEKPKKEKKEKYLSPEIILVLDDLSSELKSPSLLRLLKFNRHFKMKIIISSQWLHDLLPESRKQLDLWIIFRGFPILKLKEIHKDIDVSIPFDTFIKLYKSATRHQYSFLYIDTREEEFRRCFDQKFVFPEKEEEDDIGEEK